MKQLALFAVAVFSLCSTATAKPVSANITLQNDSQFACFIVGADAQNIRYSLDESGAGVSVIPKNQVKILITRPPEAWTEAENTYASGDYETAEGQFRKLADDYASIASLENEYGSLAVYYYLQSLKKNGKLALLADEIEKMRTRSIGWSKIYKENAGWLIPWGHIGKENWDALLKFVEAFSDPGAQNDNISIPFKKGVSNSKAAELAYFRAVATEKTNEDPTAATQDYYRALTLAYGSDRQISEASILALLKITQAAEDKAESYFNKTELHSLAILYKQIFGTADLPPQYVGHLTPPPEPASMAAPAPEKEKEPTEENPDDPAKPDDATKPDEAKPADGAPTKPAEDKPTEEKPAVP